MQRDDGREREKKETELTGRKAINPFTNNKSYSPMMNVQYLTCIQPLIVELCV